MTEPGEAELRAMTLESAPSTPRELAHICAGVPAILEIRREGRESTGGNLVDVTVDGDARTVTFESAIVGVEPDRIVMSVDRFVEVAVPLAEPWTDAKREQWPRRWVERTRPWPMPGPSRPPSDGPVA